MAKRTKKPAAKPTKPARRTTPLRCYTVPGTSTRHCVLADVARAAGTSRQALSDAVRRGRLTTLVVATLKLIPEPQARAYVAKRRGALSGIGRKRR